jgi:putative transposase
MLTEKYYNKNLPHWEKPGHAIFLTWRLFGSLPGEFRTAAAPKDESAGVRFFRFDRYLDDARFGPVWLRDPGVAEIVVAAIRRGERELQQYRTVAFAVMSNHVHLLLRPLVPLREITKGLKGVTARHANLLLGRTGAQFWQDESFDRWTRDDAEELRIARYIEMNPVRAGLAKQPKDWAWSSAHQVAREGSWIDAIAK